MAFNLQKVLQALLFSTSQPLSIKDIQAAFTRFHDQATLTDETEEAETPAAVGAAPTGEPVAETNPETAPVATGASAPEEAAEVSAETAPVDAAEAELYHDVPSLITATQIREAMDAIAAQLRATDEGWLLVESSAGYRLVTHPRFARWVRILRAEPPPVKLSQSSIETLAIVAYRQPVTRGEIETIRGVSAEAGINKLLERELVYVVGRADLPGRPIQYGTTDKFLEFVGVKSIDELPASDVLSSRQVDEWLKKSANTAAPSDTDVGLADEQLPLEAGAAAEVTTAAAAEETASVLEAAPAGPAIATEPAPEQPAAPATDEPQPSA